ncbi:MAG: aminotransferase class I/II-fold pyridoxal phosphate-dependent enzyme [Thermoanaerobaculia bacterium]
MSSPTGSSRCGATTRRWPQSRRSCAKSRRRRLPENAVLMIDDSHGVGAFGAPRARGTEEVTGGRADLVVSTLGKALGVNGGYVVGPSSVIAYLREGSSLPSTRTRSPPARPAPRCAPSRSSTARRGSRAPLAPQGDDRPRRARPGVRSASRPSPAGTRWSP